MPTRFFGAVKFIVYGAMAMSLLLPANAVRAEEGSVDVAQLTSPTTVQPSPTVYTPTSPDVIMTAFSVGDRLEVVELYNQSSMAVDMSSMRLRTVDSAGVEQAITLQSGWLLPKHYAAFADTAFVTGALSFGSMQRATEWDIAQISVYRSSVQTQSVNVPSPTDYVWAQHKQRGNATLKQTGDFGTDFVKKSASAPLVLAGGPLYLPPEAMGGLELREIHANPAACEPTIESSFELSCGDYIKVVNTGNSAVNLAAYRLRVGKFGDGASISNTFLWQQSTLAADDEYMLEPGAMLVVHLRDDLHPLSLSASGSYVWIEDAYGVATYSSVAYPDLTAAAYKGKSWAYDTEADTWRAGVPSPYTVFNDFTNTPETSEIATATPLKPCRDGQYRSEETGRCRNIALAGDTLTPCKEGQYRSEETGRCRSIVAAVAATLKPCGDDQFRNPETGRCKKIASTEDGPVPCDEGWERNPETNRCRKIKVTDMPLASFPVESVAQAPKATVVWWALGGAGTMAAGYAAWEWRREASGLIRRAATVVLRRK